MELIAIALLMAFVFGIVLWHDRRQAKHPH